MKIGNINKAEFLANVCKARTFLYFSDFLTDAEYDKMQKRILKYQSKYKIDGEDIEKHLNS